jgi:hypothetical protein
MLIARLGWCCVQSYDWFTLIEKMDKSVEPFSRNAWGELAGVLLEKVLTASARQNVSGFFDSAPRKVRESLRSE